ncbi:MAG: F0F1 ATP synthase subunit B [Paracoccaceae bacterium]
MIRPIAALTAGTAAGLIAGPALAATEYDKPFFSLANTDFIVLIAFLIFIGILVYFKVFRMVGKMLDDRAAGIRRDLDEAKGLREEAQTLLASYQRRQKDVQKQADRIVSQARQEAESAAATARAEIETTVQRRLAGAEEQIRSAEESARRAVQDRAVEVAIAAARDVVAQQMSAQKANALIDQSIATVDARLT